MKMLSIEEAQKQLAELADEVVRGEDVVLTQNGRPWVRLASMVDTQEEKSRQEAIMHLREWLKRDIDLGGRDWTRDDLHRRSFEL